MTSKTTAENGTARAPTDLPMAEVAVADLLAVAADAARSGGDVLRRWFGQSGLEVSLKGDNDLVSQADRESEEAIVEWISQRHPEHRILGEESAASGREEGENSSPYQWIIDPLDGTSNFVYGLPIFCVSIACAVDDEVIAGAVYHPLSDELFLAGRGLGATCNGKSLSVRRPDAEISQPAEALRLAFLSTGFPFRAHEDLDTYLEIFRWVFPRARGIRRCGAAALDLAHTAAGIYDGFFEFGLSPWDVAAGSLLIREAGGTVSDFAGGDGFLRSGEIVAGSPLVWKALLEGIRDRLSGRDPEPQTASGPSKAL